VAVQAGRPVGGGRQNGSVAGSESGWEGDDRAVRALRPDPGVPVDTSRWPATVPAVEQLLCEGLELPAGLTVLVGENGSGKSTMIEMLAEACGLNPQGGSAAGQLFRVRDSEPRTGAHLIVERGAVRPRWSYFLRADTMHSLYTYLEDNPGARRERFHELSHGEGFLQILRTRVNQPGFYLMDEPDAPLSFTACLGLAGLLHDLAAEGSQAVVATHSPIVAPSPARPSGNWATGASAPPGGKTSTSSAPGGSSWGTRACTSATCSATEAGQEPGPPGGFRL
jgi:predicted ATPase